MINIKEMFFFFFCFFFVLFFVVVFFSLSSVNYRRITHGVGEQIAKY